MLNKIVLLSNCFCGGGRGGVVLCFFLGGWGSPILYVFGGAGVLGGYCA